MRTSSDSSVVRRVGMLAARIRALSATVVVLSGCWGVVGIVPVRAAAVATAARSPVACVDPMIGTGGHGHTHPAASVPFGMVQLGPDTRLTGWDGCSGYHYSDRVVYGFSHTHLSGTGCSDYCDILFMPTVGSVNFARGNGEDPDGGYCSRFRHESELAAPGYYRVRLDDYGVDVELSASKRAGMHRYLYPATGEANVIIDLSHRDEVLESEITFVGDREVEGMRRSRAWAKDQYVYFAARFSRGFLDWGIEQEGEVLEGVREARGRRITAVARFSSDGRTPLEIAVGISAVGVEGARRNRDAEIGERGFDEVRREAEEAWEGALGRILVEGGSEKERRIFYTALYHAMLAPNLFMDVDGAYRGRDLDVHRAEGFVYYTVFSLWDTYRAAHPLYTIIEPERTVDFIETFLAQHEQGGRLPVWELAGNETNCMIGYHAVSVIADAFVKGIRGYDVERAFAAMKGSAEADLFGVGDFRTHGYIPAEGNGESVSKTLEYAYDDWCIAQMAKGIGRDGDHRRYLERAQFYKNLFDPSTGFMRAKMNAAWIAPFDPAEVNWHYTEANAWQYSFSVPQDVSGLVDLVGGDEAFVAKLDALFEAASATTGRDQPDITGLIGQYAQGNEPSHHIAYLYAYAGEPWKTQRTVRDIMATLYGDGPEGLCGNEDCGQMSAWYVLSALGFYPVTPGSDLYVIGSPIFDRAAIDVGGGRRFVVSTRNNSPENVYIQSASLDGEPYRASFIRHGDIVRGGELLVTMGREPNRLWGSAPDDRPRSAIAEHLICPVPFVEPSPRAFAGSMRIVLGTVAAGAPIHYTLDGREPTADSPTLAAPVGIETSTTVKAFARADGLPASLTIAASFIRVPEGMGIVLKSSYSPMYAAGGDLALIDGLRGGSDFRTGVWQGYHGVDLEATVDLGAARPIERIAMGFLQDIQSWIFMPAEVEYAISDDGEAFEVVAVVRSVIPWEERSVVVRDFAVEGLGAKRRFIRIRARSIGVCPSWHPGAGERAWIFADEIVVD